MSCISPAVAALLDKVVPVSFTDLKGKVVTLFGTGGYAQRIVELANPIVKDVIEYAGDRAIASTTGKPCIFPWQASGDIVLATGNGSYQFNQLQALSDAAIDSLGKIYIIDEYAAQRAISDTDPEDAIIIFEHADGVERHGAHLAGIKTFFRKRGKTLVSVCPLMLGYYTQFHQCKNVLVWNGQRPLYQIVYHYMPDVKPTFVEYGFFPQSDYVYVDKLGVNQECSLMNDDLDWINENHLNALEALRANFLKDYRAETPEYILVPLQVPDDANILNSSRFCNGMQEFIDYIDALYADNVKVVFKAHPKDPHRHSYQYHNREVSELPFMTLLAKAEKVHGITSSTLYEALLAGVEVISEGTSLINVHRHQTEKLLAAMLDRQMLVNSDNIEQKFINYSKLDVFAGDEVTL